MTGGDEVSCADTDVDRHPLRGGEYCVVCVCSWFVGWPRCQTVICHICNHRRHICNRMLPAFRLTVYLVYFGLSTACQSFLLVLGILGNTWL